MSEEKPGLLAIPCFNEEESIATLLEEALACWPAEHILVVNDGSTDRTRAVVEKKGVRLVTHPTNLGYTIAVQTALEYADREGYLFALLLDADGQHDPRHIKDLTERFRETDADLVIGSRFKGDNTVKIPPGRRLGMALFRFCTFLIIRRTIADTSSGFKLVHRRLFRNLCDLNFVDLHSELLVYLSFRKARIEEVPTVMRARRAGLSMYSWKSFLTYPPRTLVGILVGIVEGLLYRPPDPKGETVHYENAGGSLRRDPGLLGAGRNRPAP